MSTATAPRPVPGQEEHIFMNESGVVVSNSRFIRPGETFTIAGLTSVTSRKINPSRKGPIILLILGVLGLLGPKSVLVVPLLLIVAGIAWWVLRKPAYQVMLCSAAGERPAFEGKDAEFISRVVNAVNDAIVYRG